MGATVRAGQKVEVVRTGHGFAVVKDGNGDEWVVGVHDIEPYGGV
jgi:ABC-type tungstate transport system permease subunit